MGRVGGGGGGGGKRRWGHEHHETDLFSAIRPQPCFSSRKNVKFNFCVVVLSSSFLSINESYFSQVQKKSKQKG